MDADAAAPPNGEQPSGPEYIPVVASENLELARRAYEALMRDDIEAFVRMTHPEVEWHSLVLEMEGTFRGHEGVRQWWQSLRTAFPDSRPELADVEDHGDWVSCTRDPPAAEPQAGLGSLVTSGRSRRPATG